MTPRLLVVAAVAHLLPETLQILFGGSIKAWEYVCFGIEAVCLWLIVSVLAPKVFRLATLAVCCYGVFESIQRPVCRLMLPMDKAPVLNPSQHLCDAAGIPLTVLSPFAIALVAAVVSYSATCKE